MMPYLLAESIYKGKQIPLYEGGHAPRLDLC